MFERPNASLSLVFSTNITSFKNVMYGHLEQGQAFCFFGSVLSSFDETKTKHNLIYNRTKHIKRQN